MQNVIDHVAIGAATLEAGGAALKDMLGVELAPGGKHPDMGTHNRLTRTGPGEFVELIAIDPEAPAPGHPRWFGLDEAATRARLAAGPAPVSWVVRTDDLNALLAATPEDVGTPRRLSRGNLTWTLTVPESGVAALGGLVPSFIQWDAEPHPATGMQDAGLKLAGITLKSPEPAKVEAFLEAVGIAHLATVEEAPVAGLGFTLLTPDGRTVTLG
ncbi:VOC family protein [Acuticoccus sediminis]|uniref:VOC family protein n=1 Tax=Acuticoccus sediminis TaxID=2184697 RepID=UPI001CFD9DCE|nr:VOC family protein [Acuticoccus sediminis]